MKSLFASSSLILFFSIFIIITTNTKYMSSAKPTKPTNKIFEEICPKTKNPKECVRILGFNPKTRFASTLDNLGLGSLDIAISQAKSSVMLLEKSLKRQSTALPTKKKYENCLQNYNLAMKQLSEAKAVLEKKDFVGARKSVEDASKVPSSCQMELGQTARAYSRINTMSDNAFDIAFVIVKALEGDKNTNQ